MVDEKMLKDIENDIKMMTRIRAYSAVLHVLGNAENKEEALKNMVRCNGFEIVGDKVVMDLRKFIMTEFIRDAQEYAIAQLIRDEKIDTLEYLKTIALMASLRLIKLKEEIKEK